jgi:hypothetical protein
MVLTRRLYKFEEVRAAFLYCVKTKCLNEAVFWLLELEESFYSGEARRLLLLAWMLWTGPSRLSWLLEWSQLANTQKGRLELCWKLIRCKEKDTSIWWLLWAAICSKDTPDEHGKLFHLWKQSCQKDDKDFWQQLVDQTEDERILIIFEALQTDLKSYTLFAKCIALTVFYSLNKVPQTTWEPLSDKEPETLQETISSWKLDNIKKERIYEIPYYCLFGMTWRGAGGDTTDELRNLNITELLKSPFWKKQIQAYLDESNNWISDNHKEEFWDTYFKWASIDHPDEWSLKEQKKSHGPGVTCVTAPIKMWWRNWIWNDRLFIFGKIQNNILETISSEPGSTGISILDRVLQRYKEIDFNTHSNYFESQQKEFIIL